MLQKKYYPIVNTVKGNSNKVLFYSADKKIITELQQMLNSRNSGFTNIKKFIVEQLSLKLIKLKKEKEKVKERESNNYFLIN